jgi:hypothetical protein
MVIIFRDGIYNNKNDNRGCSRGGSKGGSGRWTKLLLLVNYNFIDFIFFNNISNILSFRFINLFHNLKTIFYLYK